MTSENFSMYSYFGITLLYPTHPIRVRVRGRIRIKIKVRIRVRIRIKIRDKG